MLDIRDDEAEVLRRLANGEKRPEIAEHLGIALDTVHKRIYAARRRTQTRTVEQLLSEYVANAVRAVEDGEDF